MSVAFNETMSFETQKCPLKRQSVGRVVRSFEIQVAKATNEQKNGSAEESISSYKLRLLSDGVYNIKIRNFLP